MGGFSLVEICIALGIASVALLSVVGLLGGAMDTSSTAGQDTSLAAMTALITGDLHAAPFDALGQASPKTPMTVKATLPLAMADTIYYFTAEGTPLTGPDAATRPDSQFQCVVKKSVDESYRTAGQGPYNLVNVELNFTWPVAASTDPAKRPGKAFFHASIARY